MSQKISLQETERKVFRSTFEDGLTDIFLGCFLLIFVIAPFLSSTLGDFWSSVVFLPFWALVYAILWLMRRNVLTPRVGRVKFGTYRKTRLIRFNVIMVVLLTLSLGLGILSFVRFDAVPGWVHSARFSLVFLISFSLAGLFLDFPRLFLYGVLVAIAPLIGELLYQYLKVSHHGYPVTFGFISTLMILIGVTRFIRLIHTHPLPPDFSQHSGAGE